MGDVEVKAGTLVNLLLAAADVDEAEFPDAQRVDCTGERNRPEVLGEDEEGHPRLLAASVPPGHERAVRLAIENYPESALALDEE